MSASSIQAVRSVAASTAIHAQRHADTIAQHVDEVDTIGRLVNESRAVFREALGHARHGKDASLLRGLRASAERGRQAIGLHRTRPATTLVDALTAAVFPPMAFGSTLLAGAGTGRVASSLGRVAHHSSVLSRNVLGGSVDLAAAQRAAVVSALDGVANLSSELARPFDRGGHTLVIRAVEGNFDLMAEQLAGVRRLLVPGSS